ncbi:MAG: organoarsenical effux MFS transporter ArsJ [Proteobacteria bacterium]|nr:organoarsenical effux MFS transporter ArsJ [Pseudomonadota bacterium]MDA1299816.1 organoarsenical effux MFS transporter ArsJ [Pseudomonadota bacterium]
MSSLRQYIVITASYWAFTLTDGALRMLVVLYFHQLGYGPLQIASLFLFYEFFGILTNLFGGWLAARFGLATTMLTGLGLQIVALSMLLVDASMLSVPYVMLAQALSGIAKDLNKMSAKSGVKVVVPSEAEGQLYRWVTALTGSKNALKGLGFFLGGLLLSLVGFSGAISILAGGLVLVTLLSVLLLDLQLGKATYKAKFADLLSKSTAINRLSAARFFLFGSRDVWFVVALPVYLQLELGWSATAVGTMLAVWIMAYGAVQVGSPRITGVGSPHPPGGRSAMFWGMGLTLIPLLIYGGLQAMPQIEAVIVVGLMLFGAAFAVNSAIHSYLIVSYSQADGVSLDVGFYYMSNAAGRLAGTLLSGFVYQNYGFGACLLVSSCMLALAVVISAALPHTESPGA